MLDQIEDILEDKHIRRTWDNRLEIVRRSLLYKKLANLKHSGEDNCTLRGTSHPELVLYPEDLIIIKVA